MDRKINILKNKSFLPSKNFKLLFKIEGNSISYYIFLKLCNLCWAAIEIIRLSRQIT
jgi:hypothetical protein